MQRKLPVYSKNLSLKVYVASSAELLTSMCILYYAVIYRFLFFCSKLDRNHKNMLNIHRMNNARNIVRLIFTYTPKKNKYFIDFYKNLVNISLFYSLPSGYKARDFFVLLDWLFLLF